MRYDELYNWDTGVRMNYLLRWWIYELLGMLPRNDRLVELDERPWPVILPGNCLARETQHLILLPHTRQVCEPLRSLFNLDRTF